MVIQGSRRSPPRPPYVAGLHRQLAAHLRASHYAWSWKEDHVYRGDTLIASVTPTGTTHLHTDHLGTVRARTNTSGTRTAYHAYYPFGEEATAVNQNTQRMKFTGHERDLGDPTSAADDLDYMHARHYNGQVGRFLSVDPVTGNEFDPQTWNRYSYVVNGPLKYIDPDGLAEIDACGTSSDEEVWCDGSIEVAAEDPGRTFDPLTGVVGLESLVSGGASLRNPGSFNSLPSLPREMRGMSFQQGMKFAVASGAGADCTSNPNCMMIAEAATALENPLLQTIQRAQEFSLFFATGGAGSARTSLRFLRYPNAGGGGVNVLRDGQRVFATDWHRFKLGGRMVNLPHFHAGPTKSQLGKHRPWQGGWKWW